MKNLLPICLLLSLHQGYVNAAVKNTLDNNIISRHNANAFLRWKTRSRRCLREEVIRDCWVETCDHKERDNLAGKYGSWKAFDKDLRDVSSLSRRLCNCIVKRRHRYNCGKAIQCVDKSCKCDGNTKNSKWWKVVDTKYDLSKSILKGRQLLLILILLIIFLVKQTVRLSSFFQH